MFEKQNDLGLHFFLSLKKENIFCLNPCLIMALMLFTCYEKWQKKSITNGQAIRLGVGVKETA